MYLSVHLKPKLFHVFALYSGTYKDCLLKQKELEQESDEENLNNTESGREKEVKSSEQKESSSEKIDEQSEKTENINS